MQDQADSDAPEARRDEYDRHAQSLVGFRLATVRYIVLGAYDEPDEPDEPDFDWNAEFDQLDWGVELVGSDDRIVGFGWESTFEDFNLAIHEGGLGITNQPILDASNSPRWKPFVDRAVTAVEVRWVEDEETLLTYGEEDTGLGLLGLGMLAAGGRTGTPKRRGPIARLQARLGRRMLDRLSRAAEAAGRVEVRQRVFPVAVQLAFDADRVWIAAVEVYGEGDTWVGADSVTVVSDAGAARRLEIWQ